MASVNKQIDSQIAHLPGVKKAVRKVGRGIEARAKGRLAAHRDEGDARIEGKSQDTDYVVSLVDENALSIEAGRNAYQREDGAVVGGMDGLRILRDSIR